jgi:hypothetical protein
VGTRPLAVRTLFLKFWALQCRHLPTDTATARRVSP